MWPFGEPKTNEEPSWDGPWTVGQGQYDGAPLFVRLHLGVGRLAHDGTFPEQVGIALPLNSPNELGLPTNEEAQQLGEIEDQIVAALEGDRRTIHVASLTTGGVRELVLYTNDPAGVEQAFAALKENISTHDAQLIIQSDPDWSIYKQFAQ